MMRNAKRFIALSSASLFMALPLVVPAEENGQWIPNLSINYRDLSYSAGLTDVSAKMISAGAGLTLTHGQLYLNTAFETDISANSDNVGLEFGRDDMALSIGYRLSDTISTFAGYKYGRTQIDLSNNPAGVAVKLTGRGPFIGAGAGWPVAPYGVLFFSAAYANLDARYNESSGKATGTSLSLGWRGRINEHWDYKLVLVRHDYYHQDFTDLTIDINEDILSINAGLSYQF